MTDTDTMRQRIIQLVQNCATLDDAADQILAALPDPRLAPGGNFPPEPVAEETEEERLLQIDPENLVVVETDKLESLFRIHYADLAARGAELLATCERWRADHQTEAGGWIDIKDDAENGALGDLVKQLDKFAEEVDIVRTRVKLRVFETGRAIDAWFKGGLSEPVMEVRGVPRIVSGKRYPPGPGTMQWLQTKYLVDKAERERMTREAAAKAAALEAERAEEEARRVAAKEEARRVSLEAEGRAPEEAKEVAQAISDRAAAEADAKRASSALIGSYVTQPTAAAVRQHTAIGTTIGLGGRWTFEVTNLTELCLAAGAPALLQEDFIRSVAVASQMGIAGARVVMQTIANLLTPNGAAIPPNFLTTDDKMIRAALTSRTAPLREAPGLRIYQEQSARRRGS